LLDGIDVWAYKMIVAQIVNEALQNQLSGAAAKNALDVLSIVELTQPPSTFQQVSPVVTAVLVTAMAFAAVWIATRFQVAVALGLAVSLSAGYVFVAVVMSLATHWVMQLSAGILALTFGCGVMAADFVFLARKQRQFASQVFSRHVPADLADTIWHRRKQFLPGGGLCSQQLTVTVLFAEMNSVALQLGTELK
jgi:hypothetical protein